MNILKKFCVIICLILSSAITCFSKPNDYVTQKTILNNDTVDVSLAANSRSTRFLMVGRFSEGTSKAGIRPVLFCQSFWISTFGEDNIYTVKPKVIVGNFSDVENPRIIFNEQDEDFIVVWCGKKKKNENYFIFGMKLDQKGKPKGKAIALAESGTELGRPQILHNSDGNPSTFLLLWTFSNKQENSDDPEGVYSLKLDSDLKPLDTPVCIFSSLSGDKNVPNSFPQVSEITSLGSNKKLVSITCSGTVGYNIWLAMLDNNGNLKKLKQFNKITTCYNISTIAVTDKYYLSSFLEDDRIVVAPHKKSRINSKSVKSLTWEKNVEFQCSSSKLLAISQSESEYRLFSLKNFDESEVITKDKIHLYANVIDQEGIINPDSEYLIELPGSHIPTNSNYNQNKIEALIHPIMSNKAFIATITAEKDNNDRIIKRYITTYIYEICYT